MAMRVNVVAKPGWILERCAREVVAAIGAGAHYNANGYPPELAAPADLTYFLPAHDIQKTPDVPGLRVGFFTHGEGRARSVLKEHRWDAAVVMNRRIEAVMLSAGSPNVTLIRPGAEEPARRPRFGVCGHFHNRRRKGVALIENMAKAGFKVVTCGNPREDVLSMGIHYPTSARPQFYEAIDYLVVTSRDEGGPMTVPEAITHHVPVIAPDVGWAWEFPVIGYTGDWKSLRAILTALSKPPSWRAWGEGHRLLFERLLAERAAA